MEKACCWGMDHPGIDIQNWDAGDCTFPAAYAVIQKIIFTFLGVKIQFIQKKTL